MRSLLLLAVMACQSGSSAPPPPPAATKPPPPPATPFQVKDQKVLDLLHGKGSAGDVGFDDYTTDDYTPEQGVNQSAADKLETCGYALTTETDLALRRNATACMTRVSTGLYGNKTALGANVIAALMNVVDHERDPELRRTAVFALSIIEKDYAPDPKLAAKLNALAKAAVKTDPDFAALAWLPSAPDGEPEKLTADEKDFALALLAGDTEPHVYDLPFGIAPVLDQTKVCPIVGSLLRPDAKSLDGAIDYVLAKHHCDQLRDAAVDMMVAKFDDEFRAAGVLDLKKLTPAQRAKLKTAAVAFRARTKDPQDADRYLQDLLH